MAAAQYTPESLDTLLQQLSLSEDAAPNHEEILKHANNVLKKSKGNPRALHTKVVALLNLDRHEDAFKVLASQEGQAIADIAILERAYCLWKLGKPQEAVDWVKKAPTSSRGLKHITAQAYYRLENFEEVSKILADLAATPHEAPNEDADLRINSRAADALLAWDGRRGNIADKKVSSEDLEIFEATFNAACVQIACGKFGQATVLLKQSRKLWESIDDLSPEEKDAELEPVIVQEIYVSLRTGKFDQAKKLADELSAKTIKDEALRVVATVNKIAVDSQTEDYNPYLAFQTYNETIKAATSPKAKPFGFQARILAQDDAILSLNIGKTNEAENKATRYHAVYPSEENFNAIRAAAQTANKTSADVGKKLEKLVAANPTNIGLAVSLVQTRMSTGNITGSISVLESLFTALEPAKKFQPGLVGLLVKLYEHQGRKQHVRNILSEASEWWRSTPQPDLTLLRAAGKSKLESDNAADLISAGEIFSSLLAANPSDRNAVAGIVASYATTEPSKISNHIDTLTPVDKLVAGIDIDALESAGVAQPPRKRSAEDEIAPSTKAKKTKKRKPRLPKNYDPSKTVDPERWLPMRDRSYYKPKGRKGKQKASASTQGGPVQEQTIGMEGTKVISVPAPKKGGKKKRGN
ncbi:signal recognition particle protein [Pyronema omphalodes]|nr:signal recognition particle protein [Pyronema omphalodes]